MASGDAYDVFVSYARSDEAAAAELNGWLCAQGFSTFFDRSALRPGLRWVPALEDAIGRSKAVVILLGKHGIGNSQQYERELALVRQTGEPAFPVIPVLMPGCDSPPTGFLRLLTWLDFSKSNNVRDQTDSLESLRTVLRGESVASSSIRASICPYRGLEPFREEDAAFFCGRDDAIRDLVARVQEHSFVAVVGPSGSGKSSLVLAGLLPALRKQDRTAMWDVVTLRPGESPLGALAKAFGVPPDGAGPAVIDTWLEGEAAAYRGGDKHKLARIVDRRLDEALEKPDRLLIYVDQWEELYAMAPAPEDKERLTQHSGDVGKFIELLVTVSSGARSRTKVVLTVRADFYSQLMQRPPIDVLLPKQQINIPALRREDLRSAIETPAKTAGLSFSPPRLVDRILDDVGLEEGRLPLLQFALKETWENRQGDRLTAEAYTDVGGVAGAIEKTAEDAYERLTPLQKDAARRLFLRLVTPGEGQTDTRARSAIPDDPDQRSIVALFATPKTRLLVTGYETLQGTTRTGSQQRSTVEVAHEALIQRWPTLRDWVRANRENMRVRAAVLRFKAEWEEHDEDEKFLLDPGVQLERGRALIRNPGDVPVDDIRVYLNLSVEKEDRRLAQDREAALADQRRIADAERHAREAAERTVSEQERAITHLREAQIMQSRYLTDQARQHRAADPATAMLLALEALPDVTAGEDRPYFREAELQLHRAWRGLRERLFLRHQNSVNSAAFSPDGQRIITACWDRTARVWSATTGQPVLEALAGHDDAVYSAAFSPDGKHIVTASQDRTARIWDAATGQPIGEPLKGHNDAIWCAAFGPDGKRIITASWDRTARVWDAATGKPIGGPLKGHDESVCCAAFSPDGQRIVTASEDRTMRIWDAATGMPIVGPVTGHDDAIYSAAFSPDGQRIVTGSWDGTARVWEAATGVPITELRGHRDGVISAAFSPDGKFIVTASKDKTARIWDIESGKPVGEPLAGHDDAVYTASFSPDGDRIITASWDRTARVWDVAGGTLASEALKGHSDVVSHAAFSPDGRRVVTSSYDNTARLWGVSNGEPIGEPLVGHEDDVVSATFSPDGKHIVTASWDRTARVWDAETAEPIGSPLIGHTDAVLNAMFAPDGKRIVTASQDKTARIWETESGSPIGEPLTGHDDVVFSAAFSPDGQSIVTASSDRTARVWNAATAQLIGEPLAEHSSDVFWASISPDGKRIVTASWDRTARVWDAGTGKPIGEPLKGHEDAVWSAGFSPDGKRIVTASSDKTARIWDADTGKPIGEPLEGHSDVVWSAAFSPDGTRVVTASSDKTARLWIVEVGKPSEQPEGQADAVKRAALSPDGTRGITSSSDGTPPSWNIFPDSQAFISAAKAAVPRCLTPAQRKAFFLAPEPPAWCIEMGKWPCDTLEWKQWLTDKRDGKNPSLPREK
jgi:WD40 repeat protein/energy-coupling factor transporter ATP-binding protein EcfA2